MPSTATANANEVIATYVPPSDLVQEFKVQTATFDAQFGNTEGGVTSISIKSGTNRFHGSVYYFAEPYEPGRRTTSSGRRAARRRSRAISNRPGFTIGGPVGIPELYNGKDKTFFMFGYERITDERPRFDAGGRRLGPDRGAAQRRLLRVLVEHHDLRSADPRPERQRQFVGTAVPGQHHPGEPDQPRREGDPGVLLPAEERRASAGNITDSTLPETADYNTLTGRVDQKISNNNRMFARYSWYKRDSHLQRLPRARVASGTWFQFQSYQAVVDDVHVFNPTTVLNVRYGYNRFERNSGQEEEARNFDLTTAGLPRGSTTR